MGIVVILVYIKMRPNSDSKNEGQDPEKGSFRASYYGRFAVPWPAQNPGGNYFNYFGWGNGKAPANSTVNRTSGAAAGSSVLYYDNQTFHQPYLSNESVYNKGQHPVYFQQRDLRNTQTMQ